MHELQGRPLVDGSAAGDVVVLTEPLSFWGGFDVATGTVIGRHAQAGTGLAGRIVVMPSGRGSSSSSSVLAEAIRAGTAPNGILIREPDPVLTLGAIVATELYGETVPVVVVDDEAFATLAGAHRARIASGGRIVIDDQGASSPPTS